MRHVHTPGDYDPDDEGAVDDRRAGVGRREDDRRRNMTTAQAAVWAVMGSVVVLYLFFIAVGSIKPATARAASIIVAVLALIWLGHSLRLLWSVGFIKRTDCEP